MTRPAPVFSRRKLLSFALSLPFLQRAAQAAKPEPIIDIHQHTPYAGRTNDQLRAHQRAMGATTTILLPAGRLYGLAAGCGGNETVVRAARGLRREFVFFANEISDDPGAEKEIKKYLRRGAVGIGEQKFNVACDSDAMVKIAEIARDFKVPVLMHFWEPEYNMGFQRFHRMLEKFPTVNFIGHAQTWWGNIDKNYDQAAIYPMGKVAPGGITDRLLSDYPNVYGDLSAQSGLNAFIRDEDHARDFIERHQNKLLFGSDCNDTIGRGSGCLGSRMIAAIRRLSPSKAIERKLLHGNAKKLFKLRGA